MNYNKVSDADLKELQSMVSKDRFSIGDSNLDLHSRDQSKHEACRPEVVIWPVETSEVSQILKYANNRMIPVTAWGSGSSLEGNPIPVAGGIVLDFSQMDRIIELKDEDFQADIEPGVIYQDLNEKLKYKGLFFPPDPGARATLGGMIANNSAGTRTVRYGATKDYVLKLTVVMADGEVVEMGTRSSKSSSGYDLIHLFVGSEGTLGIVTNATVRLVGLPAELSAAIVTFPSVEAAGKAVFDIIRSGLAPAALELLAPECIELINKEQNLGLKVSPTLFMEYHGPTRGQLVEVLTMAQEICESQGADEFRPGMGSDERDNLLKARHELGEMIIRTSPDRTAMSLDVAVPITAYPELIFFSRKAQEKSNIPGFIFSHAGDGNLHFVLLGKTGDEKDWAVIDDINRRVVTKALEMGGTATGEHGVGLGKRKFMEAEHGKSLEYMKKVKSLFDLNGILNPGKIFP
jgi:D-lactate dehydrogenase (cytochrome)